LQRQTRWLAWGGIGWHFIEYGIALAAGLAASSIALIGFGMDSLIEALAGFVVLWLFTGKRLNSPTAERRAEQMIAISFYALAAYVGFESLGSVLDSPRSRHRRCRSSQARNARSATSLDPPLPSKKRLKRSYARTSRSPF